MTVTMFATLLVVLALAVSLITQAVKSFLSDRKYSANLVVLIVSIIVGAAGCILTYVFMGIPFTPPNIACIPLMAVAVWVGAMVGYDKVLQMIDQMKNIHK